MIPPPRRPGRYAVALVCLGNICRSPMADVVLRQRLLEAGLADRVTVASAGTAEWHVGKPMDPRAAATLDSHGFDPTRHRARHSTPTWLADFDLVLAMDADNLADLGGGSERVMLFRDPDPDGPGAVPDPYYGGDDGFEEVLAMVERTTAVLVREIGGALAP